MKPSQKKKSILDEIPSYLFYYPTAFFAFIVSIIYSAFFLFFQNEPPELPTKYSQPIDCSFISIKSYSVNGSRISFNLTTSKFYQFPKSATLDMLKVYFKTGRVLTEYTSQNFWDTESDLTNFFFNVLHPYTGETSIELMCSRIPIVATNLTISDVNVYSVGWSHFKNYDFSLLNAFDFCWVNGSLIFSTVASTMSDRITASFNSTIPVNYTSMPTTQLSNSLNIPFTPTRGGFVEIPEVLLLDSNPKLGYVEILDVLIPVWIHSFYNSRAINQTVLLTKNQEEQIKILQKIFPGKIKLSQDTNQCFTDGIVLSSLNGIKHLSNITKIGNNTFYPALEHLNYIFRIKPEIINSLRERFVLDAQAKRNRIVLDKDMAHLKHIISEVFPKLRIDVIDDTEDIRVIAKLVSKASVLVASNILTMSYSIFLQPKVSTLVEVAPNGFGCAFIGRRWAHLANVKYAQLGNNENTNNCVSVDIEKYMENLANSTYPIITKQNIELVFNQLL